MTVTFSPFARVVAVTSGKGGVGKTNIVAGLAMAFAKVAKGRCVVPIWAGQPGRAAGAHA